MIAITGAAGFIGSNLSHYLTSLGYDVLGIDALLTGSSLFNLKDIDCNLFTLEIVDLRNAEALNGLFLKYPIEYIYHLAAESHVDRSIDNDISFWTSNVIGTRNLLQCALQYKISKVLNQITDEVFGPKKIGYSQETDPFLPTSPYAASKAAQYYVGRSYFQTYGLQIVSTFPSNTYGPRQYPEKLIPKFIQNLKSGKRVPLMTSVNFERDWLAIPDHIKALVYIMEKGVLGEGYNIPGMGCITNKDITKMLLDNMNKIWEDSVEIIEDRKAHDCRYSVNGKKLLTLGWKPTLSLESYLPKVIEWYLND